MPRYLLKRQFAEVQPDFDWPLVPRAPDPEFKMVVLFISVYMVVMLYATGMDLR